MSQKPLYLVIKERYDHTATPSALIVDVYGVALDFDRARAITEEVVTQSERNRAYVYEFTYDARLHCIGCMGKDNAIFTALNWGRDCHPAHWSALLKGMAMLYSMTHTAFGIVADRLPGDVAAETIGIGSEVVDLRQSLPFASDDGSNEPYPAA